jgi:hypothetical protein
VNSVDDISLAPIYRTAIKSSLFFKIRQPGFRKFGRKITRSILFSGG